VGLFEHLGEVITLSSPATVLRLKISVFLAGENCMH
jgi:hypothetical protein